MLSRVVVAVVAVASASLAHAGGVYWTDRGASQLKRMRFDGSGLQTLALSGAVTSPGSNIRGIAVDGASHRLFWADNGADRLLRVNTDGSDALILHSIPGGNSFPADVRLDLTHLHFYWCDQLRNRIQRSALDGTQVTDVITNAAASGPYFMDLDVAAGKIYWGDFSGGSIYRANLDGSNREVLLTGNNSTRGVRVDAQGQSLYWINRDDKKVHRCSLSLFVGTPIPLTHPEVQTLYSNLDTPHGLTLDIPAQKIYWADTGTNPGDGTGTRSICRGDFDGSTPLEILATGSEPWDVDLDLRCADYADWVQRCFRRDASASDTAFDADPDGDGLPNFMEYAFDLSPTMASRNGIPRGVLVAGPPAEMIYGGIRYLRREGAGDLNYEIQASTDLVQWDGGVSGPRVVEIQSMIVREGMESVLARTLLPVVGVPAHFLRLRVRYGQ